MIIKHIYSLQNFTSLGGLLGILPKSEGIIEGEKENSENKYESRLSSQHLAAEMWREIYEASLDCIMKLYLRGKKN